MAQNQKGGKKEKGKRNKLPTTRRSKSRVPARRTLPAYPKGIWLPRGGQTTFLVSAAAAYVLCLAGVVRRHLAGVTVLPHENFTLLIACVAMPVWFVFRYVALVKFGPREGIKSAFLNAVIVLWGLLVVLLVPNAEHWFLATGILMAAATIKDVETILNYCAGRTSALRLAVMRRKAVEDGVASVLLLAQFVLLHFTVVKQEWRPLVICIGGGLWAAWVVLACLLERPPRGPKRPRKL